MAFGGYKFKGYKVVRANLATNTYANWCLLVHQARIKAFMESCALSGAQWHFSKTNGALSFESYGNVIYRVANANGDYNDYLSFFQYGNESLYYMISTLGEFYDPTSSGSSEIPVMSSGAMYASYSQINTGYKFAGMSSALSLSAFDDNGPFGSYPVQALPTTSVISDNCEFKVKSSGSPLFNTSGETATNNPFSFATMWKVGFATKDKDILSFSMNEINNPSICVESGDSFQHYLYSEDNYGLFKTILSRNRYEASTSGQLSVTNMQNGICECLSASGNRCNYDSVVNGNFSRIRMVRSFLPLCDDSHTKNFYDSIGLYIHVQAHIPADGNLVKGVLKNPLISQMVLTSTSALPGLFSVQLGGNLICCDGYEISTYSGAALGAQSDTNSIYFKLCVGWDPSNPSILDESSWPELALQ